MHQVQLDPRVHISGVPASQRNASFFRHVRKVRQAAATPSSDGFEDDLEKMARIMYVQNLRLKQLATDHAKGKLPSINSFGDYPIGYHRGKLLRLDQFGGRRLVKGDKTIPTLMMAKMMTADGRKGGGSSSSSSSSPWFHYTQKHCSPKATQEFVRLDHDKFVLQVSST